MSVACCPTCTRAAGKGRDGVLFPKVNQQISSAVILSHGTQQLLPSLPLHSFTAEEKKQNQNTIPTNQQGVYLSPPDIPYIVFMLCLSGLPPQSRYLRCGWSGERESTADRTSFIDVLTRIWDIWAKFCISYTLPTGLQIASDLITFFCMIFLSSNHMSSCVLI